MLLQYKEVDVPRTISTNTAPENSRNLYFLHQIENLIESCIKNPYPGYLGNLCDLLFCLDGRQLCVLESEPFKLLVKTLFFSDSVSAFESSLEMLRIQHGFLSSIPDWISSTSSQELLQNSLQSGYDSVVEKTIDFIAVASKGKPHFFSQFVLHILKVQEKASTSAVMAFLANIILYLDSSVVTQVCDFIDSKIRNIHEPYAIDMCLLVLSALSEGIEEVVAYSQHHQWHEVFSLLPFSEIFQVQVLGYRLLKVSLKLLHPDIICTQHYAPLCRMQAILYSSHYDVKLSLLVFLCDYINTYPSICMSLIEEDYDSKSVFTGVMYSAMRDAYTIHEWSIRTLHSIICNLPISYISHLDLETLGNMFQDSESLDLSESLERIERSKEIEGG